MNIDKKIEKEYLSEVLSLFYTEELYLEEIKKVLVKRFDNFLSCSYTFNNRSDLISDHVGIRSLFFLYLKIIGWREREIADKFDMRLTLVKESVSRGRRVMRIKSYHYNLALHYYIFQNWYNDLPLISESKTTQRYYIERYKEVLLKIEVSRKLRDEINNKIIVDRRVNLYENITPVHHSLSKDPQYKWIPIFHLTPIFKMKDRLRINIERKVFHGTSSKRLNYIQLSIENGFIITKCHVSLLGSQIGISLFGGELIIPTREMKNGHSIIIENFNRPTISGYIEYKGKVTTELMTRERLCELTK